MLYEVITLLIAAIPCLERTFKKLRTGSRRSRIEVRYFMQIDVITSYSIHYTKLYDKMLEAMSAVRAISICPAAAKDKTPGKASSICFVLNPAIAKKLCASAAWLEVNIVAAPRSMDCCRITSYNVCYTQLLRQIKTIMNDCLPFIGPIIHRQCSRNV